ncbi:hypothetical protein [Roseovarius confluentis]|uniref:hypothetical protein n=1 Tax=Roseovarius confluentis TaxID=1852027 RepID=UPI003BAB56DD
MFDSLVTQAGGKDAAAATIEAATGNSISIGTLTKIKKGDAEVPLLWVWALMDATGNTCFDRYRARKIETAMGADPYALIGETAKEHGEALSWGIKAVQSGDAGDHARAAVEHRQAADKHTEAAESHEVRAVSGPSRVAPSQLKINRKASA